MSTSSVTPNIPLGTKTELVYVANTFVRKTDDEYEYYRIKLAEPVGNFSDIEKYQGAIDNGFVCFKGKVIEVKANELIKGRVNVSRITTATVSSGAISTTPVEANSLKLETPGGTSVQQGSDQSSEDSVGEIVNLAWSEQIGELLHNEDPEAEWEIMEDAPQPQQANADSSVQVAESVA